jgi:putative membrane protein
MTVHDLPAVNAALNFVAFVLLVAGFVLVKKGRVEAHKKAMLAATGISVVFLVSYLARNFLLGDRKFPDHWFRPYYLAILFTHLVLAVVNVPLIVVALRRAFRVDLAGHRKIVRFLFPSWCYVSATGVLIYFLVYRWFA